MRQVMIGCPCHDAKVHARWANSYGETLKQGLQMGVDIHPLFIPGNAMIHDARNEIVAAFRRAKFDDLIFIDADISWEPVDFFKLLNHQVDAVGATYPRKQSVPKLTVKTLKPEVPKIQENGLMQVRGLGMGFFRLSRRAIEFLWDISQKYYFSNSREPEFERRSIFEFGYENDEIVGEDISMCSKLSEVWLDPSIILEHSGDIIYTYSPMQWFADIEAQQKQLDEQAEKARAEAKKQRESKIKIQKAAKAS